MKAIRLRRIISNLSAAHTLRPVILVSVLTLTGGLSADGQLSQGPRPGAGDPLGKPSRYTILPSHELLTVAPNGTKEYLATSWTADDNLQLTPSDDSYTYTGELNQIFAAGGRILAPGLDRRDEYDQIVFANRSGSNVAVSF